MHVIAISNQKGGVAKTTTTIALAAALAEAGERVLVVDLDPQANLTLGLGVDPEEPDRTAQHLLTNGVGLEEVAIQTDTPDLGIVPGHITLASVERSLYGEIGFDEILRDKVRSAGGEWDRVLVDCPPSLGLLTMNAMTAADCVLVPVQCEYFSAKGLEQLIEVVGLVRSRRNPDLVIRVLPTLYDRRNNICQRVLEALRETFPDEILDSVINIDTKLREAAAEGEPITRFAPRTRASRDYRELAEEVRRAA